MARKLRVEFPGTIYHVMNRGDRREKIFRDDQDRAVSGNDGGGLCQDWLADPPSASGRIPC